MGVAIETIVATALNPGAGPAVGVTTASGDTLQVRSFAAPAQAYLANLVRMGTTAGFVGVTSPMLHDNVFGIRVTPAESPSVFSLPGIVEQALTSQDTLAVQLSGGAAETDLAALVNYYTDLGGAKARLVSPGDIANNIKSIKPLRVAVTTSATVGQWVDTAITATEDVLHANTDYAVLGYMASVALGVIAIKGQDTSNLRAGGPGSTQEYPTTQYFAYMAEKTGRPWIPVINSANKNGTFVSTVAATPSVVAVVELILAELVNPIGS